MVPYWLDESTAPASEEERTPEDISKEFYTSIKDSLDSVQHVEDIKHEGYKVYIGQIKEAFVQVCLLESFLHVYFLKKEGNTCVHATNQYGELPELFTIEIYDYDREEPIKTLIENYNIEDFRDLLSLGYDMFDKNVKGQEDRQYEEPNNEV